MKEFLKKIWTKAKLLFTKADDGLKRALPAVIKAVNAVKSFVDSPADDLIAEVIKSLIPGKADDVIIDKVKSIIVMSLPILICKLEIVHDIADTTSPTEKATKIVNNLKFASDEQKNIFFHNLAALLIKQLSDGKLSIGECFVTAEFIYNELKDQGKL